MKQKNASSYRGISHFTTPVICLALIIGGCVQIRQLTYPETFTWIGQDDISNSMQSMAKSIARLDKLVLAETQTGQNRQLILDELEDIEYTAAELSIRTPIDDDDFPATNHLLIDEHMEDFLEDILKARIQLQANPSNYYSVGQLTGSCMACHRLR